MKQVILALTEYILDDTAEDYTKADPVIGVLVEIGNGRLNLQRVLIQFAKGFIKGCHSSDTSVVAFTDT